MLYKRDPAKTIGRSIAFLKAAWDLYWKLVVPGALYLNEAIKERRRRKQSAKEEDDKPSKEEHPRTRRLRRELERERRKREAERQDSDE